MGKLTYEDDDGEITMVSQDIENFADLINMFYRLSLGIGYLNATVDRYVACDLNDFTAYRYDEVNNNDL